jgi:hypothetical protein
MTDKLLSSLVDEFFSLMHLKELIFLFYMLHALLFYENNPRLSKICHS